MIRTSQNSNEDEEGRQIAGNDHRCHITIKGFIIVLVCIGTVLRLDDPFTSGHSIYNAHRREATPLEPAAGALGSVPEPEKSSPPSPQNNSHQLEEWRTWITIVLLPWISDGTT